MVRFELHGRAGAAELAEVTAALGEPPELLQLLGDIASEHRAARSGPS